MIRTTWEKHLLSRFIPLFFLILTSFFFLYALIDYSSRTNYYQSLSLSIFELVSYFLAVFATRLELLIPFALLAATIGTLASLNIRNELISLLSAGYSKWRILHPFVAFSLLVTLFLYVHGELLVPHAIQHIYSIKKVGPDRLLGLKRNIFSLNAPDGGTLLFHFYNPSSEEIKDVWWLRQDGKMIHMSSLSPFSNPPQGKNAYLFSQINRREVFSQYHNLLEIPELSFDHNTFKEGLMPAEQMPLYLLWKNSSMIKPASTHRESEIQTLWFRKLFSPWLAFFVITLPAPFCLRFSRQLPIFMIFTLSVVSMISFYLVLDSMTILSEGHLIPPFFAVGLPFFVLFGLSVHSILKLKNRE